MRRVILSLFLVGAMALPAFAQCGPWGCPVRQPAQSVQLENRQQPYPSLVCTEFIAPNQSERMIGSGVIVAADGKTATVLTCAHGYKTLMRVVVVVQGSQRYRADIVGVDAVQDVMVLRIVDPGITPHPIASTAPVVGERVYACGFANGSLSAFTGSWGTVNKWLSPEDSGAFTFIETTCAGENGKSGGPILNSRGQVVGLITGGGSRRETCGPCLPRVRKVLKFLLPPYPNRPGAIVPKLGRSVIAALPPKAITREPLEQIMFPTPKPPEQDVSVLLARIEKLESRIAALQARPGLPGPAGKTGPPGRDGKNAPLRPIPLDDLVAKVVGRLPPIHVRVIRDGKVIEESDVFLGGTLPLHLIPVPVASPRGD